jgi:hypothetical protein
MENRREKSSKPSLRATGALFSLALVAGLAVACASTEGQPRPGVVQDLTSNPDCSCYTMADHQSVCCKTGVRYICQCDNNQVCMVRQLGRC